jgi:hypothetical protein
VKAFYEWVMYEPWREPAELVTVLHLPDLVEVMWIEFSSPEGRAEVTYSVNQTRSRISFDVYEDFPSPR